MTSSAKRKAPVTPQAQPPAEAPAIIEAVEAAPVLSTIPVDFPLVAVTLEQLAKCIETHENELVNHIRSLTSPSDGAILTIIQTLDRLAQIIPTKETPA